MKILMQGLSIPAHAACGSVPHPHPQKQLSSPSPAPVQTHIFKEAEDTRGQAQGLGRSSSIPSAPTILTPISMSPCPVVLSRTSQWRHLKKAAAAVAVTSTTTNTTTTSCSGTGSASSTLTALPAATIGTTSASVTIAQWKVYSCRTCGTTARPLTIPRSAVLSLTFRRKSGWLNDELKQEPRYQQKPTSNSTLSRFYLPCHC